MIGESERTQRELDRICWRAHVMSLPGGVEWLIDQAEKVRFNERQLGPWLGVPA